MRDDDRELTEKIARHDAKRLGFEPTGAQVLRAAIKHYQHCEHAHAVPA